MRARMISRCLRTVRTELTSVQAISALLCPCATRSRTCHSLGVSRGARYRRRLASPIGLLEVRPEQDVRPEQWMSPSRRYLTPCGPKTRHRGRIGRWAGLTEPQFFGMAGPASSLRPSSSSPTSARRSRSVRDAEEDTEFSRYKSRRPNRTSPTIPPPVPGGNPPFGEWSLDRWPARLDQRGRRRNVPVRRAAREQRSSPRRGAP